ncbi:hypothetical protein Pfo_031045 [Paulownia fortunei]|nr:hypothetical protein Pfo_031045 [Paulownia fortunei]
MGSRFNMPEINLKSGTGKMPVLGFGTSSNPPADSETTKRVVLEAIQVGYRHFDTAALYIRDELFITSKLWCSDAHGPHVLPAMKRTLK